MLMKNSKLNTKVILIIISYFFSLELLISCTEDPKESTIESSSGGSLSGYANLRLLAGGNSDAKYPYGTLVQSGDSLYGLSYAGGASDFGTLFKINTDGTGFAILHTFIGGISDGAGPRGSLTLSGSTLYGVTAYGGTNNSGTIFSISTSGSSFCNTSFFWKHFFRWS